MLVGAFVLLMNFLTGIKLTKQKDHYIEFETLPKNFLSLFW